MLNDGKPLFSVSHPAPELSFWGEVKLWFELTFLSPQLSPESIEEFEIEIADSEVSNH